MLSLLIDNDVLIKCACYAMLDEIQPPGDGDSKIGVLGAARFVVNGHLARRGRINDRESAQQRFNSYIPTVLVLEPTEEEIALATEIEEAAIQQGVDLDSGESQLCAIAIFRAVPLLLTGDKRAISGAEILQQQISVLSSLRSRVVCLEQAVRGIANRIGVLSARSRICAEPSVDKSLSICFECNTENPRPEFSAEGLTSYITHLRAQAPTLLYGSEAL